MMKSTVKSFVHARGICWLGIFFFLPQNRLEDERKKGIWLVNRILSSSLTSGRIQHRTEQVLLIRYLNNSCEISNTMYPAGYVAEVVGLSPNATEKDVHKFFSYCGELEHVEIIRSGEYGGTAYVTFKDAYALETAVLLSGATIVDQPVCIIHWGMYVDESDPWSNPWIFEENAGSRTTHMGQLVSTPGEAVTVAQQVVKTMLAKGYVLSKDALVKAKALDESYGVSAAASAKVADLSYRIGLTDRINAGMKAVKTVDDKYHVFDITKSAASVTGNAAITAATFTGKTAVAAGTAFVNSRYFAKGALWVSGVLDRAAKAAADMGTNATK